MSKVSTHPFLTHFHFWERFLDARLDPDYGFAMSKTATIRAQIEPSLKEDVDKILSDLGLTASQTIQLLYSRIRKDRRLPFPVETPNKLTARTLRDSRAGSNVRRFACKQELYTDLGL